MVHKWTVEREKLPDGTEREWNEDRYLTNEKLPDGTVYHETYDTAIKYDKSGNIIYHATNGVDDTKVYRAKQRVENKKAKNLSKLEDKPKLQKVVAKIADSKVFKDIALKVAMRKANNGK